MAMEIGVQQTGQLPQVKGPEMNDRDRANDILSFAKYATTGYTTGLHEMQNPQIRATVQAVLNDLETCQSQLFDLMFQKGWYKMKAADPQEISQTFDQFNNYRTQFPTF